MTSIDERVVNMVFNNDKFEKAIKASISSLDTLKSKLKFDKASGEFKKLEKASKEFTLNDIGEQVESLSNRFSNLGVVGMSAINNLTTSAMRAGKNLFNSTFGQIISGGKRRALNIEQAKFQIEGLGYAWEDVEEDINYGVKDTAYGLDAAARAASQLLASSVQIGPEMKAALRGISGVAAMTGSDYEDISSIFTTVAGNGRLMTEQLNQMAGRGLNAAATLAQAFGITEAEVREMVSKGKVDFKTFATIMDDAFGEHAKKANDTFTGSLSNMKAALSRVGAELATPAYQHLRDIINKVTPVINSVKTALEPIYDTVKKAMEEGKNFIVNFLDPLTNVDGANVGKDNLLTNILLKPIEHLNTILTKSGGIIVKFAQAAAKVISPIGRAFKDAFGDSIFNIIDRALDLIGELVDRLMITDEFGDSLYKVFNNIFNILRIAIQLFAGLAEIIGGTLAKVSISVFGFIIEVLVDVVTFVTDCVLAVKDFIKEISKLEVVQMLIETIGNIFENIKNVIIAIATAFKKLVKTFSSKSFEAFKTLFSIIGNILLIVAQTINNIILKVGELIVKFMELPIVQEVISRLANTFSNLQSKITKVTSIIQDKLISGFTKAKAKILEFINAVKSLISKYVELPSAQEVVTFLQEGIRDLFDKSKDTFEKVTEVLGKVIEKVKELSASSLTNVIENFEKLRSKLVGVIDLSNKVESLKGIFNVAKEGFLKFASDTGSALDGAKGGITGFIDFVQNKFTSINFGQILAGGLGVSLMKFFWQFGDVMEKGSKFFETVNGFTESLLKIGNNIAGTLKEFKNKIKAEAEAVKMKAIAAIILSLAALAAALVVLSMMDPQRVQQAALVLGALAVGIIALSTVMVNLQSKVSPLRMAQAGYTLMKVAAALIIMIVALQMLTKIDMDGIGKRLIVLGVVMAELALFMVAISKIDKDVKTGSLSIIAISASILLLAIALRTIGSLDFEAVVAAAALLGALIISLKALAKASSEALYSAGAIIGISIAMILMITALKKLSNIPSSQIIRGLTNLLPLVAAISLLFLSTRAAGRYAVQAGGSLILISAALIVMTVAIKRLADIDTVSLDRAGDVIARIILVFAAFTGMTLFAGKNAFKAGSAIVLMSASMIMIAGAMAILAQIEPEALKRATGCITILMGMFALIVASTNLAKDAKSTMAMIAVSIGTLAVALAVLSMIEPKNVLSASIALSLLMASLALLSKSASTLHGAKASLVFLSAVVVGLALLLKVMSQTKTKEAIEFATGLSELLLAMSIALGILSTIHVKISVAAEAAAALGAFIAIITTIISALTSICSLINDATNGEFAEALNKGIPILESVGNALGSFVGGIISGVLGSSSKSLATIGQSLSDFMINLKGFIDGVKSIDDTAIRGIEQVGKLFLTLSASNFINSFSSMSTSDTIKELSGNLSSLGEGLKTFATSLTGIDINDLDKGAEAAKKVAEVAMMLSEGGLVGGIFGSKSEGMKSFAENIEGFGEGLKKYASQVANLRGDAIENSVGPAKALIEMVNMIQKEAPSENFADIMTSIFGSSSAGMKALSENLPLFGTALTKFQASVLNLHSGKIEEVAKGAKALIEMINMIHKEMPGEDFVDISTAIFGSSSAGVKALSTNLPLFGEALSKFSTKVYNLRSDRIEDAAKASKSLIEVLQLLQSEGGVVNWFAGSNDIAAKGFIENLSGLGEALSSFSENVKDIKSDGLDLAISTASAIASIYGQLHDVSYDNWWDIFSESTSDTGKGFNSNVEGLGNALKTFSESVSGISGNVGDVEAAVNTARSLADVYSNIRPALKVSAFGLTVSYGSGEGFEALANNCGSLGEALSKFAEATANIDPSGSKKALVLANDIVDIYNSLEPSGGAGEFWFGSRTETFTNLSTNLMSLSNALQNFATASSEISADDLNNAIGIIDRFRDLSIDADAQKIANIGTSIEAFGTNIQQFGYKIEGFDTDKFGSVIEKLGDLKAKVEEIGEIDTTNLNSIIESLGKFAESGIQALKDGFMVDEKVQEILDFAKDIITQIADQLDSSTEDYAERFKEAGKKILTSIGEGIQEASESLTIPEVNSMLDSVIATIATYYERTKTGGKELGNKLADGIKQSNKQVNNMVDFIMNKALAQISLFNDKFKSAGTAIFKKFADGIKDPSVSSSISSAMYSVVDSAIASANVSSKFYTVGTDCARGLAKGLNSQESRALVSSAGGQLSYVALLSSKKAVDSKSPSKKYIELGKFCVQGLAIGLSKTGEAVKSSELLGDSVISASRNAMDKVYNLLSEDLNPTITPHFNLSEVKSGYNEMNRMLNTSQLGVNARIVGTDIQRAYNNKPQTVTYKTENNYMLENLNASMTTGNIENLGEAIWGVLNQYLNLSRI